MNSKVFLDDPDRFDEFVTRLFKRKDVNKKNKLTYNEIKEILDIYYSGSEKDLQIEFNKIDTDHDGELGLEDFKTMFKNVKERLIKARRRKSI